MSTADFFAMTVGRGLQTLQSYHHLHCYIILLFLNVNKHTAEGSRKFSRLSRLHPSNMAVQTDIRCIHKQTAICTGNNDKHILDSILYRMIFGVVCMQH